MAKPKLSPMMQQYLDIKEEHQDCILFFRLGDFYEMFFEDAKTASRELELTLTGKQCGLEERAPMCGVPFHAAETYISRLIDKGYKVAVCEQTEDPAAAKGIVKREVIQIVTPGTVVSSTMLREDENNFIASVYADDIDVGLSYCDVSTGEIRLTSIENPGRRESLINELVKISAREVILDVHTAEAIDIEDIRPVTEACFNIADESCYRREAARDLIKRQFGVSSLHGIGIEEDSASEMSLGALLFYLHETQKNDLSHIRSLNVYFMSQNMSLDKSTIKNLELTETLFEKKLQGSLLGVLDKTHTAMGSRKMKQWLKEPLNSVELIRRRLDGVETLLDSVIIRNNIKEYLRQIYDFERLAGRIATGKANGRDLKALSASCRVLPEIRMELESLDSLILTDIHSRIFPLARVFETIDAGIVDEPPFTVKEGGLIRPGYSEELDDLKASIADARSWIASLEAS
ncbi:MAG: DNA mismatch repair protein MutS, partial [Bacillota bacterium]|nr:DNA mismatch repair protein MutS [Bacillota bacterium]